MSEENCDSSSRYWLACLRLLAFVLSVWFAAAYVCAILFRDWMDENLPSVGHAPFGFWMAQQGAILIFVALLLVYRFGMNHLDQKYAFAEEK
jgi:putative solute:sodium symporter small subunit